MAAKKRKSVHHGRYEVSVGNEHYCCSSLGVFSTEREAERAGKNWMRGMVAMEPTAAARREARESYIFEIRDLDFAG